MRKMLILSFSNISADARVLKQITEFTEDFHITTCGYGPKPPGSDAHVRVPDDRIFWAYSRIDLILKLYKRAYWTNSAITYAHSQLGAAAFDVILANEIDAVPLALSLRPNYGVHADVHEYSPKEKEDVLRWRLFVGPFRKWLCKHYLSRCESVTTVSDGVAAEYKRVFGLTPTVSRNATPFHELKPRPISPPIKLVHSGACLRDRDPIGMIEGVLASNTPLTFDLYLTPNDPGLLDEIKALAEKHEHITVHDPVPYANLVETLNGYDLGVFMLRPVTYNYMWALPNKLFDNVQARLGQIISPNPEMKQVVEEYGLGAVTSGYSPQNLKEVLDSLTPEDVWLWKKNADEAATPLSAAGQTQIWRMAIENLISEETTWQ